MNNSNNPFETNNKKRVLKQDFKKISLSSLEQEKKTTSRKQRSSTEKTIRAIFIALVVLLIIVIFASMPDSSDSDAHNVNLNKLKVEEDYTYDFSDINGNPKVNPYPEKLPKGQNYRFDMNDDRLMPSPNVKGMQEINLVVGVDIKPGVYTIQSSGGVSVTQENAVETYFDYFRKDNKYYNVALMEGDTFDVDFFDDEYTPEDYITLTAQSDYVDFKPGRSGVFVYGLNQFDSEVKFDGDSYERIIYGYNVPRSDKRYESELYLGEDVTLPGSPGSYFAVDYGESKSSLNE